MSGFEDGTKGAKILGVLGGISTGIGIVGAVAGFFGSRRKRRRTWGNNV